MSSSEVESELVESEVESKSEGENVCKIHVPDNFEEQSSFLVNFSNGQLLQPESAAPRITLYNKLKDRTKRKRILVAETNNLAYIGTNFDSKNVALNSSSRYCIGALDRETGVMTLHRTELVTMQPHIPGTTDIEKAMEEDDTKVDTRQSLNQMVSLFGSERQKRAFSAAQKNRLESGILDSALETAFSHAQEEVDKMSSTDTSVQNSGLMPPYNAAAEVPQDVYDISDILSVEDLKILTLTAKTFTEATPAGIKEWRLGKRYPEYILQHIQDLPSSHTNLKAAMILYACFLIQMHNMTQKHLQKGLKFEGLSPPPEVLNHLCEKYAERRVDGPKKLPRYSLPPRMKDKIRLHLLVLCLFLDNFTVEFSVLREDLKISASKMKEHFKALGCMIKSSKKKSLSEDTDGHSKDNDTILTAILTIPLRFPKPSQRKRKRED